MGIYEMIDGVLAATGIPYFEGNPEFGEDEPQKYFIYSVSRSPAQFAENQFLYMEYAIDISFLTPDLDTEVREALVEAFSAQDFVFMGEWSLGDQKTFPYKRQFTFEFKTTLERGK